MSRVTSIVALGVLLGVGLGLSVRDWRAWKYEETKNYGYGPGELYTPAEEMVEHYINQLVGIKFNYPSTWEIIRNSKFDIRNQNQSLNDTLRDGVFEEVVRFETKGTIPQQIIIKVGTNFEEKNLADAVDREIELRKVEQLGIVGERIQVNSDRGAWTMVNYATGDKAIKEVYSISGKRMFVIRIEYAREMEMRLLKTYEEYVRNIILI